MYWTLYKVKSSSYDWVESVGSGESFTTLEYWEDYRVDVVAYTQSGLRKEVL